MITKKNCNKVMFNLTDIKQIYRNEYYNLIV